MPEDGVAVSGEAEIRSQMVLGKLAFHMGKSKIRFLQNIIYTNQDNSGSKNYQ